MRSYHLNYGEYPMQFSPVGVLGSGGVVHRMFCSLSLSGFGTASALLLLLALSPVCSRAQEVSPQPGQTESSDNTSTSASSTHAAPDPANLEVSWRKMPVRFLRDQKDMWLFPVKLAEGKHWLPTAIIVGGTAAFLKEDPPLERKIRQTDIFNDYNKVLKSSVSGLLIAIVPTDVYQVNLLSHAFFSP
jgi:hypothetical protein